MHFGKTKQKYHSFSARLQLDIPICCVTEIKLYIICTLAKQRLRAEFCFLKGNLTASGYRALELNSLD